MAFRAGGQASATDGSFPITFEMFVSAQKAGQERRPGAFRDGGCGCGNVLLGVEWLVHLDGVSATGEMFGFRLGLPYNSRDRLKLGTGAEIRRGRDFQRGRPATVRVVGRLIDQDWRGRGGEIGGAPRASRAEQKKMGSTDSADGRRRDDGRTRNNEGSSMAEKRRCRAIRCRADRRRGRAARKKALKDARGWPGFSGVADALHNWLS